MHSSTYTVSTTRQIVVAADNQNRTVYLHVIGTGIVYLGGADVTSTNGMPTEKSAVPFQLFVPANEALYAITATATEDLRILTPSID